MPRLIIKRYISLLYLSLILLISIGIELPNQPHHSYMNIPTHKKKGKKKKKKKKILGGGGGGGCRVNN